MSCKYNVKPDSHFYLRGYKNYRNDSADNSGDEVLIAVNENFKCREMSNKTINNNEALAVEIRSENDKSISVASVYVPPRTDKK
jgi:hypothetical protein